MIADPKSLLELVLQNLTTAEKKEEGWYIGHTNPLSTLSTIINKLAQKSFPDAKKLEYIKNFYTLAVRQTPPYPTFYCHILEKLADNDFNGAVREYVIHLLQQRLDYNVHNKKDTDKTTDLQKLIDTLTQDKSDNWLLTFKNFIAANTNLKSLVGKGNTGKLLKYLQDQNFSKANQLIAEQDAVPESYFTQKAPIHPQQPATAVSPVVAQRAMPSAASSNTTAPRTQRVFSVGEDINDYTTTVLAKHFYASSTTIVVETLMQNSQHQKLRADELNSLVCLGHANQETFGGFEANAFVKKLKAMIETQDYAQLEHLYLVGCELGLRDNTGQSLAQTIADQLQKAGFSQVKIHSVAKPYAHLPGTEAMFVHVLDRIGLQSRGTNILPGYIYADLHTQAAADEILALETKLKQPQTPAPSLNKKLNAISEDPQKTFHFLKASDPQTTLDRAENTFVPNENILQRNQRIAKAYHAEAQSYKSKTITALSQQAQHQENKKAQEKANILWFIIGELQKTDDDAECKKVLTNLKRELFEVQCLGVDLLRVLNHNSTTYQLLEALCQDKQPKVDAIMTNQQKRDSHAAISPQPNQAATTPTAEQEAARQAITAFKAQLDREIAALERKGISFLHPFNSFTHTTKTKKSALLQTLLNTPNLQVLKDSIDTIFKNSKKYSRELNEFHTRRTVDLLEAIRDNSISALEKITTTYSEQQPLLGKDDPSINHSSRDKSTF